MAMKIILTIILSATLLASIAMAQDTTKRREQAKLAAPGLESVAAKCGVFKGRTSHNPRSSRLLEILKAR